MTTLDLGLPDLLAGQASADGLRPRAVGVDVARHPAVDEGLAIYNATSSLPMFDWAGLTLPAELHDYLANVYAALDQPLRAERGPTAAPWDIAPADPTDRRRVVLFSGGKDSVACALQIEERGQIPILYHLAGLNRGMGDEPAYAQAIATYRGWRLIVDRIRVSGSKVGLVELPTKNQVNVLLAAARMIDAGLPGTYVAGWHRTDDQDKAEPTVDYSDGAGAIALFDAYTRARAGIRYESLLFDTAEAWARVAAAGMLRFVKGCVCPVRYKRRVREANQRKFGPLLNGRCGACVKCAVEQIALEELGAIAPNPALRKRQERYLLRDVGAARLGPHATLADAIEFLVPAAEVAKWRRDAWPVQVDPIPLGLGHQSDIDTMGA